MQSYFPPPGAVAPCTDEKPEGDEGAPDASGLNQGSDALPVKEASVVEGTCHIRVEGVSEEADAKQPPLPMQSTLGQWLRTCASATDLEVASMLSMAPSMVSTTELPHAAPGSQRSAGRRVDCQPGDDGMKGEDVGLKKVEVPPVKIGGASDLGAGSTGEAEAAQWTPRSCKAFRTSEDGASPRTCVTSVAERAHRLPKWARGLEALQSPQLQALAQQWQQQQAHLSSIHLHPHEEEQDAELRYLQDNSAAFEDQEAPAEQEEPQPQEDQSADGRRAEVLSSSDGRRGLLSQALQAEPPAETAEDVGQAEDEAASQDTAPQGNIVARLVRHWQHHPISQAPVSRLRLDRSTSPAEPTSNAAGGSGRYVTPVVLSKVQHYLDTSAPAPVRATLSATVRTTVAGDSLVQRDGVQTMPAAQPHGAATAANPAVATESSIRRHDGLGRQGGVRGDRSVGGASCWSTVTQAERTQWWGKGNLFSEKRR
ncbi:g2114 [Coccomyxa viridis]|uniref:G2114 protein n=1 Tax=Coccomyxa viridis TaxID=1274662 RepID=A0ABP1FRK5_9CHLO